MKNKKRIYIVLVVALFVLGIAYLYRVDLEMIMKYGFGDRPTHSPMTNCSWEKDVFENAGITAFVEACTDVNAAMVFSDSDKKVIGKWSTNPDYEFTIQIYAKDPSQNAEDVMEAKFAKLTADQQKVCEIQDADVPLQHFSDGTLMTTEDPHPTSHKTRYKIDIKPDIVKQILEENGGDPGGGEGRDYMCGKDVGAAWGSHSPYFEFDERDSDKYIFVGSYGSEGPTIDLNSLRF